LIDRSTERWALTAWASALDAPAARATAAAMRRAARLIPPLSVAASPIPREVRVHDQVDSGRFLRR
jgi:hypothetical protein